MCSKIMRHILIFNRDSLCWLYFFSRIRTSVRIIYYRRNGGKSPTAVLQGMATRDSHLCPPATLSDYSPCVRPSATARSLWRASSPLSSPAAFHSTHSLAILCSTSRRQRCLAIEQNPISVFSQLPDDQQAGSAHRLRSSSR